MLSLKYKERLGAMSNILRGIFPVVYNPFSTAGEIDEEDLRKLVEHLIACGVHGLLADGGASECYWLSTKERKHNIATIIDQAKGRVPVIAGVSAQDTKTALDLAHYAEQTGASAILSTPPSEGILDADTIHAYYQILAQAVNVPIIVHTLKVPFAMVQLYDLIREFPNITHIKEETPEVAGHAISEILRLSDGKVQVFSGSMHLLDELARGAVGAIPGSICVADQVRAYDLFTSGDHKGARHTHNHVVPLIFARNQAYLAWGKEILRRQGIFKTAFVREPGQMMDEYDQRELTAIMDSIGPPF